MAVAAQLFSYDQLKKLSDSEHKQLKASLVYEIGTNAEIKKILTDAVGDQIKS